MRSTLANTDIKGNGMRALHFAAGFCCPGAVSILLEAGADKTARDAGRGGVEGRVPLDVIGEGFGLPGEVDVDQDLSFAGCYCAVRRTELDRGRGPLMKKVVPVMVAMILTPLTRLLLLLPLLLPLLLASRLCESSDRRATKPFSWRPLIDERCTGTR